MLYYFISVNGNLRYVKSSMAKGWASPEFLVQGYRI